MALEIGLSGQMFDNYTIWDHLMAAADFGYKSVELRSTHVNPSCNKEELDKIKEFLLMKKLKVGCLSCFTGNYGLLTDAECIGAFNVFKEYIKLAVFFESEMIRVWPAWQESSAAPPEIWERAAKWMKKSCEYAAEYGKKLVMEMHHGTLCDSVDSSLKLLNMINCDNVGVTLDPVNLYQVPADYSYESIKKLGSKIFNVHIKDIIELPSDSYPYCFKYSYYVQHIGRFTKVIPPKNKQERFFSHRRINHGGIDWREVLTALKKINYTGYLIVESVCENNKDMPSGRKLAEVCYKDVLQVQEIRQPRTEEWKVPSPSVEGFHEVVSPKKTKCEYAYMYRLNLPERKEYILNSGKLEMNAVLINGKCSIKSDKLEECMHKFDSFYIPGKTSIKIAALENCTFYIGAAECNGIGKEFFRKYEKELPFGEIRQIHGNGISKREVYFTLNPEISASRLICGITWGGNGSWTSWPPHQHGEYLEEIYCYFDMPPPGFGMHLVYCKPGRTDEITVHIVKDGDVVIMPYGYHPTVAAPGTRNTYFWILAAKKPEFRRYDLSEPDECFK
ncbi:MAG: 5-deoxy-glucuronate isomerase [Firmicutes bacterium]|nr:5-deoxy-glucuronate isomerase [Bacillota bacterium]